MSRRPRRNHSPAFRAKVALEAAREEYTLAELSKKFDAHQNQIAQWKTMPLERMADVFDRPGGQDAPPVDARALHAKIGDLTLENDILDGALTNAGWLSAQRLLTAGTRCRRAARTARWHLPSC